jgi:hypothetical protein
MSWSARLRTSRSRGDQITEKEKSTPVAGLARGHLREANMIAIIAIGWLLAIWAMVLAFSVFFSQNMK